MEFLFRCLGVFCLFLNLVALCILIGIFKISKIVWIVNIHTLHKLCIHYNLYESLWQILWRIFRVEFENFPREFRNDIYAFGLARDFSDINIYISCAKNSVFGTSTNRKEDDSSFSSLTWHVWNLHFCSSDGLCSCNKSKLANTVSNIYHGTLTCVMQFAVLLMVDCNLYFYF